MNSRFTALRAALLCALVASTVYAAAPLVSTTEMLTLADLQKIFAQAADRAKESSPNSVISVVNRDGVELFTVRANGSTTVSVTERFIAVSKAGTGAFLSSNDQAFSTRTAGFIVQQHFPPLIKNRPTGPLVGVPFSNMAYSDVNYFRALDGSRIIGTRLYGSPGGVPLYKNGQLVGGIGVTGDGTEGELDVILDNRVQGPRLTGPDVDEAVALSGQIGFAPAPEIYGSNVLIDGIRVDYISTEIRAASASAGVALPASVVAKLSPPPAPIAWQHVVLGGVPGELKDGRGPSFAAIRSDTGPDGKSTPINGQARLTAAEVAQIIAHAAARTTVLRAGIRLPASGARAAQVHISVVGNPNQAGAPPPLLGSFRTPDAPIFGWDVSVQKARTALFFSSNNRAYSCRTVGFLSQSMYPPGLENQPPGPFNGLQERFSVDGLILGDSTKVNPNLPNGITIFPGGFPLYRNGVLIGAIGISGDGIEHDDMIGASGTDGYQAPVAIRADNFTYLGARLPYAKFPRDSELRPAETFVIPAGYTVLDADSIPRSTFAVTPEGFEDVGSNDAAPGNVINLSARGYVGPGGPLILGFITDSTGPSSLLLRGVGPTLSNYGVTDALPASVAALHDGTGATLAVNSGWSTSADANTIANTATQVGAFALPANSADSAIVTSPTSGVYSVVLNGADNKSGTALAEIYDASQQTGGVLKNVSIRGRVEGSDRPLIAGLYVADGSERTVLIRGVGPALAGYGVNSPLQTPRIKLLNDSGQVVAEGSAWDSGSNSHEISAVSATVGAFPLAAGSSDMALLVNLGPGKYSVVVTAPDGAAGEALAEIYAVPK